MHAVNGFLILRHQPRGTASFASNMYSSMSWWETSFTTLSIREIRPRSSRRIWFREIEIERPGFETEPANALRQLVGLMQHLIDRPGGRGAEEWRILPGS